jgi:hypothetical protein
MKSGALVLCLVTATLGDLLPSVTIQGLSKVMNENRQVILTKIVDRVVHQAKEHESGRRLNPLPPSAMAIISSLQKYRSSFKDIGGLNNNISGLQQEELKTNLFMSVLKHAASDQGQEMLDQLYASGSDFASADAQMSINRTNECALMRSRYRSSALRATIDNCLCDPSKLYTRCRILLANQLLDATRTTESTASANDILHFRQSFVDPHIQPVEVDPRGKEKYDSMNHPLLDVSAKTSIGQIMLNTKRIDGTTKNEKRKYKTGYNAMTGSFKAEVCFGVLYALCIKVGAVAPSLQTVVQAAPPLNGYVVRTCFEGTCNHIKAMDLIGMGLKQQGMGNFRLQIGISLCLKMLGLMKLLDDFGISLCVNFVNLSAYVLQGPMGEASMGIDAFPVTLSAWLKVKFATNSPLCPQDWNRDLRAYACQHRSLYHAFVKEFSFEPYCNMDAGDATIGVTVTIDLWFWTKSYHFMHTPPPRPVFTCNVHNETTSMTSHLQQFAPTSAISSAVPTPPRTSSPKADPVLATVV